MYATRHLLARCHDARRSSIHRAVLCLLWAGLALSSPLWAADRAETATAISTNFEVLAESEELAQLLATRAEELRQSLSIDWLESELPAWETRCVVRVDSARERLSGDTTYTFAAGRLMRWRMELRGPPERILETLLPHEVLHTVLASHYRCAVPRWADEGAALSVEPEVEKRRLWADTGPQLLREQRRSLAELFACEQYPDSRDDLRAFYAHGASVTEFLLLGGKSEFVEFVGVGMQDDWDRAAAAHYGFSSLDQLEAAWRAWLQGDRPDIALAEGQLLADGVAHLTGTPTLAIDLPGSLSTTANGGAQ